MKIAILSLVTILVEGGLRNIGLLSLQQSIAYPKCTITALALITWFCDHTSPSGHAVIRYELLILGSIVRYYFSMII